MTDLTAYGYAGFFFLFAILFVFGGLLASSLLRRKAPNKVKYDNYECGEAPIGSAVVSVAPSAPGMARSSSSSRAWKPRTAASSG